MRAIAAVVAFLFFPVTIVLAEQPATTVGTTVTVSEEAQTSAIFTQLVREVRSYHGRILNVAGQMYSNPILKDQFTVTLEDGFSFVIELDDGRQVTQRASKCPYVYLARLEPGCQVTLDIELDLVSQDYSEFLRFSGIGFNVNFE